MIQSLHSISKADRDATRRAFSKPAAFVVLTKGLTLKTELTAARLRELLHYDPETGIFIRARGCRAGKATGAMRPPKNYLYISVNGASYSAHRLAWMYVTGAWPKDQIDHRDGDRANNAFTNLRECGNAENSQNRGIRSDNASGFVGVTWDRKRKAWRSQIKKSGRNYFLGWFATPSAASEAYLLAKADLHKFQPAPRGMRLPSMCMQMRC